MRIGIDARMWNETGIGRYVRNLCINLSRIDHKNEYVLFILKADEIEINSKITNDKWKIVTTKIKWHSLGEQLKFPKTIEKEKIDLMHFPYQLSVPIFYKKPFIITIHDLVRHHFITGKASTNPIWLYGFKMLSYKILINIVAKRSKKIITVSNSTKRDVMDNLRIDGGKIEIVYEAADDFSAKGGSSSGRKLDRKLDIKNYFLYVGNIYPHKNADMLINAFKEFAKENDTKLVFVGGRDKFYKDFRKYSKSLINSGKIIIYENPSDGLLFSLYKNAICLVRPSLMEGFSLPPLEAMKAECLVLASSISTHKEIFGDTIIYFDPYNIEDLKDKMNYVKNLDKKAKEKYIKKGISLSSKFSWEDTARLTLKVYENSISIRSDQ